MTGNCSIILQFDLLMIEVREENKVTAILAFFKTVYFCMGMSCRSCTCHVMPYLLICLDDTCIFQAVYFFFFFFLIIAEVRASTNESCKKQFLPFFTKRKKLAIFILLTEEIELEPGPTFFFPADLDQLGLVLIFFRVVSTFFFF